MTAFEAERPMGGWRFAYWDADRHDDLRGFPPAKVHRLQLSGVVGLLPSGLGGWARSSHREAVRQLRAAGARAMRAGHATEARSAETVAAELELEEADAADLPQGEPAGD